MVDNSAITVVHIEQDLNAMVLLVEEVDLVLQLLHVALVHLLLVLHVDLVDVLSALVEGAKSQNFVVSDLDCTVERFDGVFKSHVLLDELIVLLTVLVRQLVGFSELGGPLLVLGRLVTATAPVGRFLDAVFILSVVEVIIGSCSVACVGAHAGDVLLVSVRVESSDDLILRRHIEFLHSFVKLGAQLDVFGIKFRNFAVFLCQQEFQILHLVLCLAALGFPFQVSSIGMISELDQFVMKDVVLLDKALVLLLKGDHRLAVETGLVRDHCVLVFELLERLGRLQYFVQQALD